jgi:hypothetical protein
MGLKNQESYEIFSPQWSTDSLKKVGFKSTHYALGELIDNSIQSALEDKANKSCEVQVIGIDKQGVLSNLIVIDDAGGMTPEILRLSLGVGRGRALEDTKKNRIGEGKTSKFGLGLKQASLSQCQRFEVYTWQNNKTYMSYLDTEEMKTGKLKFVPEPILKDIPEEFRETIKIKNSKSGTCIIWYNMHDNITWKTSAGLFRNAELELGRIYRYLIQKGAVKITLTSFEEISKGNFKEKQNITVRKNDPLFLMKDCVVRDLWDSEEQFDEVDEEEFTSKNGSIVKIKYSVANKKFREAAIGSKNKLNALCGKNAGVSVLRNGRELELNKTFLTQDLRERFIGIEVHFDATLDELMDVDGKKQSANNFYKRDIQELIDDYDLKETEFWNKLSDLVNDNEELLIKISNAITKKMGVLLNQIRNYRTGSQKTKGKPDSPEAVGTTAIGNTGKTTQSDDDFKTVSEEEKIKIIKEQLEQAEEENADEGAEEIVKKKLRFHFTDVNLPAQMLFDIQPKAGIYNIQLNKNHPAFNNFFKLIAEQDTLNDSEEHSAEKGLKLLLESWARLEDEASENLKEELQNIRLEWGKLARLFFRS